MKWTKKDVFHSPILTIIHRAFFKTLWADTGSWIIQEVVGKEKWTKQEMAIRLWSCVVVEEGSKDVYRQRIEGCLIEQELLLQEQEVCLFREKREI